MNKKSIYIVLGIIILILIGAGVYWYYKKSKTPQQDLTNKYDQAQHISDDTLGISFYIDKSFERIDQKALSEKNPFFVYGFAPKDVADVGCYISQTKRTAPGEVTTDYLKEGTFNQIKQNNANAVLKNSSQKQLGQVAGVMIDVEYSKDNKNVKILEVVGTNDKFTTFAFCETPQSLYEFYRDKFDILFNSLEINK